ncbi:hypothetical protein FQR65_LT04688 [Abscondita terminalis]|nr:hypothetical protein FQR65_LT04688 [Abscondita terminalis]
MWHTLINNSVNLVRVIAEYNNNYSFGFSLNTTESSYVIPFDKLPKFDYSTLMNLTRFRFTILNNCTSKPILLVLVHSAPGNYDRRKSVRDTWGAKRPHVAIFFMLGGVTTVKAQLELQEENAKFNDIIQGSFLDAYRNMTFKHVMTLKYAIYHCSQAKYVLKTDDDVYVNMPTILDFLTLDLPIYGAKRLLSCSEQSRAPVERSYRSKWRVSFLEYNERYYPPYCPGWIILYSMDVVFALYREVQKWRFFWIDDVLITGLVRKKLNITLSSLTSSVLPKNTMKQILSHDIKNSNIPTFIFGPVNLPVKDMYALSEAMKNVTNYKPVRYLSALICSDCQILIKEQQYYFIV